MSAIRLEWPKLGPLHAALTRLIGAGRKATIESSGTLAEVRICFPPSAANRWEPYDTAVLAGPFGEIEFVDGVRFFRVISGIDIGMGDAEQRQWLSAAALGRLARSPFAAADRLEAALAMPMAEAVMLRVGLRSSSHALFVDARASAETWMNFLGCAEWTREQPHDGKYADLPVALPVRIASHAMDLALLESIKSGDTVVPDSANFDCAGTGWIDAAGLRLQVRYLDANRLEIVAVEGSMDIESVGTNEGVETSLPHEESSSREAREPVLPHPELERLPVRLDFDLGHLQVPIAELRTVAPGMVFEIEGASPASVAVTSSGRLLGKGEIVDVGGKLGIRIVAWG